MSCSKPARHIDRQLAHLLPINELEKRTKIAVSVQSTIRGSGSKDDFSLRAEHIAVIMTVPLSLFEPGQPLSPDGLDFELKMALDCVASFCKYYLRHLHKQELVNFPLSTAPDKYRPTSIASATQSSPNMDIDEQPLPESDSDSNSDTDYVSMITNFPPLVDRHDIDFEEQTKCLMRDGNVCVVTGTTGSKAYHIAPFTWNDTQAHINQTKQNCNRRAYVVGCDVADRTGYLNEIFEPGASDKAWNMISLHPMLYSWWNKGYFAFKCLELQPLGNNESNVVWSSGGCLRPSAGSANTSISSTLARDTIWRNGWRASMSSMPPGAHRP